MSITNSSPVLPKDVQKLKQFKFPSIYNFPPFFTRQPNQRTFESQLRNWSQIIVQYCKYHKVWVINKNGVAVSQGQVAIGNSNNAFSDGVTTLLANDTGTQHDSSTGDNNILALQGGTENGDSNSTRAIFQESGLFNNCKIKRHLKPDFVDHIFHYMIENHAADWYNQDILNNYQKDSDSKTAIVVYWKSPNEWAQQILNFVESTGNSGAILTLFELTGSELVTGQEFYGLHPFILHKALMALVRQNRAQLMKDENGVVAGVKII